MNIGRLSIDNLDRYGEYDALLFDDRTYTNRERLASAATLADVLVEEGVSPGNFVIVSLPNSPWVVTAYQAIWKVGAVPMPIMPQLQPAELCFLLSDSRAQTVLTAPHLADGFVTAKHESRSTARVLTLGHSGVEGVINLADGLDERPSSLDRLAPRADDDLALLVYTSGTTGRPKGVMLTHGNMNAVARSAKQLRPHIGAQQPCLLTLPLSHTFGVNVMNTTFILGSRVVLHAHFEASAALASVQRHGIVWQPAVPTMLSSMLACQVKGDFDVSSLQEVWVGGAILPNDLRVRFERTFECEIIEGYGQTECAPLATLYTKGEAHRPGSVGRAIPGVDLSIRDEGDEPLGVGSRGEICIRGGNVMKGYLNMPEETANTLRGGWLHSGDIGFLDEDGYLYITDRKKDLIIKGGENISPREIEEVLHDHPAVSEVAVIGVPDDHYGEDICAVVSLKESAELDEVGVLDFARTRISAFKIPSRVVFMPELPKSGIGKILKKDLRKRLGASV